MGYPYVPAKPVSYGGTRALSAVKYIVIHYTGVANDTAKNEVNYFANGNTRSAGAHYFVDQAGKVYQSIALNRIAWSVGGFYTKANGAGSYYNICTNTNSVSIELCDNLTKDPSKKQTAAVKKLVSFIKGKCPNAKTIIRHWDVNGKLCPARMAGKNNAKWTAFKKAIGGGSTPKPSSGITFTYAVKAGGKTYPSVKNLEDYAGVKGKAITALAVKASKGKVKYRVHVKGGKWLPYVTGYSWKDKKNGFSGNGKPIDAIQVILSGVSGKVATYRVSPLNGNYYPWQKNSQTSNGQDGYAGLFGKPIDRIQIH